MSCSDSENNFNAPIPIKVVVVTMFDRGVDGEFYRWQERRKLDTVFEAPNMHHDIHVNLETGVMGIVTGMGTANSAASIMALGLDSRFDLTSAYWLVVGIAGFDPEDASLGSVAIADFLVDGDLAHEIDSREIPDDWSDGFFPLFSKGPNDENRKNYQIGEVFQLKKTFVDWAYNLTNSIELYDDEKLSLIRDLYVDYPQAVRKPFVLRGDQLAAMTFWHGNILNDWANRWVDYWSKGEGEFVSSAMEDTGTFQSLDYLDRGGYVDKDRLLVIRTASNFTIPAPNVSAVDNLLNEQHGGYTGLEVALENGYIVGSKIIDELLTDWQIYKNNIPSI